ncbi:MAG: manganese transporter [Bacteroidetes bacterium]|nr:MAG: manganese transporter [Bacteroidota bacterium]MBL1145275.1 manganese transporter [Bacteroidota bacterium]MCB0803849.1 zinc ABC transporter substrate-binding protein [Flavobacteriales bacterium]NOG58071.1 zinc ABC transporter solute-binding protein [Bacteroidota bacterium]
MKAYLLIFTSLFFLACNTAIHDKTQKKVIVCTTGMLGDAVENIVKDNFEVITLMGAGVDPHLYKATHGDISALSKADIIIYNGLHLEGKMGEIFQKLANRKKIIVASDAISPSKLINNTDFAGATDPHIWFDVELWSEVVLYLGNQIGDYYPEYKEELNKNTKDYHQSLLDLNMQLLKTINSLDSSKRILITAHDAFGYFGRAYSFQVKGLQGISTVSEYGLKDVSNLVKYISEHKIKAVFVESSVSDRSLKAVVEGCKSNGHQVKIGGTLYSDAMGESNTPEGTYIGMLSYNVNTIVNNLK